MKVNSAKNKGRRLQQWIRDKILEKFPELASGDVRSTSMGVTGEDIQLSPLAESMIPYHIEAKSRASIAIYSFYEQPKTKSDILLIVKANHKQPLAIVDADLFLTLLRELNDLKTNKI
jgi:hypothetical protein